VYVHDLGLFGNESKIPRFKKYPSGLIKIKDIGSVSCLLSNSVKRESAGSIALHQKPYAKEVLENFGMSDCKGSSYPIKADLKRSKKNRENRPTSLVDKPFDLSYGSWMSIVQGGIDIYMAVWRACLSYAGDAR